MKNGSTPPIYSQVAYDIAMKIAAGEITQGGRFTGRSLMGSQYGVSPETIRRAMRLLDDMGIISTQANVGSVVLSQDRAKEYVEQYRTGKDLRLLKAELQQLVVERESLNEKIKATVEQILDLSDRFRHSDTLRTYEYRIEEGSAAIGLTIGALRFRQRTGATVVAVRRGAEFDLAPGPETILLENDVLIVACALENLSRVAELLEDLHKPEE
jgi:K+/H+ antiporter YhaU regulatory subunit KhtT